MTEVVTAVVPATPEGLERAAALLRDGAIVAMPTETVYGLAGNALDEDALLAIFSAKQRPLFDPLIAHIAMPRHTVNILDYLEHCRLCALDQLTPATRDRLDDLLSALWPGPLTVVVPRAERVPDLLTSGLPSVAVRMPAHPTAQALLRLVDFPLAAPSANRFGRLSPTTAAAVKSELAGRVPLILDGGACQVGVESTIVGLDTDERLRLLRPGGVPIETIEAHWGVPVPRATGDKIEAPGQLASHYAPRTPLRIVERVGVVSGRVGVLFATADRAVGATASRVLAPSGDSREAARRLFALLRELDDTGIDEIVAERWPDEVGLGLAINDRLRRAAAVTTTKP